MLKKYIVDLMSDNPLNGISTYQDTLNLATGDVTRRIKKYVINGNEGITGFTQITGGYRFSILIPFDNLATLTSLLCSHYYVTSNWDHVGGIAIASTKNRAYIIMPDEMNITTIQDMNQWLTSQYDANSPVTIWYVSGTITAETITVPGGLSGTINGYLNRAGTPTPTSPIYPIANNVTMWANYTPQKYNGTTWQTATGQPEQYNGGWT